MIVLAPRLQGEVSTRHVGSSVVWVPTETQIYKRSSAAPYRRFMRSFAWTISVVLLLMSESFAQSGSSPARINETLSLALYKSGIVDLEKSPSQISVGNPGIADILILRGSQIHVIGKALGSTNVVFWDRRNTIFATLDIEVTHDLVSLKQKLFTLMPEEDIGVHSAQENLVLKGTVSSAVNLQAALDIASSYLPECIDATSSAAGGTGDGSSTNVEGCKKADVINLMSVGGSQQVMLEVKIAEVSRTFLRNLDTDLSILNFDDSSQLGVVNGGGQWPISPIPPTGSSVNSFNPFTPTISDKGLFFSKLLGNDYFQIAMEISRSKGLSKILAEPNLTTLTGRQAKFVSGGEFPITVTTRDGVDVIYKEFGVIVDFLPTILDDSRISLDLDIGVSDLRIGPLVGGYPIIDKRGASSTVELRNGQTIGIAGLIQDDLAENFSRLPGLGDIPILGALFRSQNFQSGQTELVMFVTPHLAAPISPDLIRLPTDSFVPPSDVEFYLLGNMASTKKPEKKSYRKSLDGGFDGVTFGHKL